MAEDPLLLAKNDEIGAQGVDSGVPPPNLCNDIIEDEETIHIPLWQQQRGSDEMSTVSSSSSALLTDESNEPPFSPKLPLALLLSYAICGLTLSLPTLPMMYILNTKVALPLSVLPIYGALSFLPYSLKPLYAYVSSYFPRRLLLSIGWATCALTTIAWIWVPSIPWVFVVGIANNIATSWSSFLLGLTLIDNARALSLSSSPSPSTNDTTFEKAGSLFQSQAATARNIGSLTASILTCLIFHQTAFSKAVVDGIFGSTAACFLISFLLILWYQDSFTPTIQLKQTIEGEAERQSLSRRHSYAALEMAQPEEDTSTSRDTEAEEEQAPQSKFCNLNVVIIAGLQLLVIMLALKQQILQLLLEQHSMVFKVMAVLSVFASAFLLSRLDYSETRIGPKILQELRKSWGRSHVVGLVLILRHAVPSASAVLYSFLYHCFQAQPGWLQVFSLVDTVVVTMASWSYERLWAPHYSHGRKLITFMMITTVVAHSMGSLYIALVYYYNDGESQSAKSLFPWLVLCIKAITTFVSEWNFLPSVVLATVSLQSISTPSADEATGTEGMPPQVSVYEAVDGPPQPIKVKPALSTNIMYGSFVSCIDFGDQVGAILSAPLVIALGITRDNNWQNLGIFIPICSGLGVLSACYLLLLKSHVPRGQGRQH